MSKWLVVGASSFSGKHFCAHLRSLGEEVIEQSLRSFQFHECDYVMNFAAVNVVAPSWHYPEHYIDVNVKQQASLFEDLRTRYIKRYVHISTPEVYGSSFGRLQETQAFNPSTPYAVSRAACEMLLACYHNQYSFPIVVTRSCNVYGPGQQLYRLIPKLIASARSHKRFPLEGEGKSLRSFIYVTDLCEAIRIVATKGYPGLAYHVSPCRTRLVSIAEVIEIVCKIGKFTPIIEPTPERPGKDPCYDLANSRIRSLGWQDTVSLEDGIAQVVKWMDENWDSIKDWPMEYEL